MARLCFPAYGADGLDSLPRVELRLWSVSNYNLQRMEPGCRNSWFNQKEFCPASAVHRRFALS